MNDGDQTLRTPPAPVFIDMLYMNLPLLPTQLADFGLARRVAENPVEEPPSGTPSYMAPEVLRVQPHGLPVRHRE